MGTICWHLQVAGALSARCQSLSNRIEQSRLAWRHRSSFDSQMNTPLALICSEERNRGGKKDNKKHSMAFDKMDAVIPGLLGFSPSACRTWRRRHTGAGCASGEAELHLYQDNRVPLSQEVYTLSATESGQVEEAGP